MTPTVYRYPIESYRIFLRCIVGWVVLRRRTTDASTRPKEKRSKGKSFSFFIMLLTIVYIPLQVCVCFVCVFLCAPTVTSPRSAFLKPVHRTRTQNINVKNKM